jgi:hypothetical protein
MRFERVLSLLVALAVTSTSLWPQEQPQSNPPRDHAFELYGQGKMVEAMPLLEELSAENPKDIAVMESWGPVFWVMPKHFPMLS